MHGADLGHATDVITPQIQQHQVLGQFFFVRQQIGLQCPIFFRGFAPAPCPGDGPDRYLAAKNPNKNLGGGTHHLKPAEIEVEHERRGVGAPQAAIERERRQRKILRPALRGHHLKNVTGPDVFFGCLNRLHIRLGREVRLRLGCLHRLAQIARFRRHRAFQIAHGIHDPFGGLRIGAPGGLLVAGPGGGNHGHVAFDPVKHGNHCRSDHDRIGQLQRVGVHVRQVFDMADHIVAQIAEKPGRGLRQICRQIYPAFGDQGAQIVQRVAVLLVKSLRIEPCVAVQVRGFAMAAPDQIGFHTNDRIPPAHLATGDRFQHKRVFGSTRQLEHQRNRRIQISGQTRVDDLVLTSLVRA